MARLFGTVFLTVLIVSTVIFGTHIYRLWIEATASTGFLTTTAILDSVGRPLNIATATVAGLISSSLFAVLQSNKDNGLLPAFRSSVNRRSLVLAAVIAPIVICSIYDKLATMQGPFVVALFSYQNAFFWESLIGPIRGRKE